MPAAQPTVRIKPLLKKLNTKTTLLDNNVKADPIIADMKSSKQEKPLRTQDSKLKSELNEQPVTVGTVQVPSFSHHIGREKQMLPSEDLGFAELEQKVQ